MCGTLNPMVARAEIVDDGFVFSGRATYLSGSAHANWTMATAIVTRDGEPVDRRQRHRHRDPLGIVPAGRARDVSTPGTSPACARPAAATTQLESVMVAEDHTFEPFRPRLAARSRDVFSAIPLWSQLGGALAAVAVGAAANMIERFIELAVGEGAARQLLVGWRSACPRRWRSARRRVCTRRRPRSLTDTADAIWERGVARAPFDNDVLARHRLGYVTAVRLAGPSRSTCCTTRRA